MSILQPLTRPIESDAVVLSLPVDEAKRQQALDSYEILDTLPEQDFDDLAAIAAHICDTPIAAISFIDRDRQWFKAKLGLEVQETPRDIAFCDRAIRNPAQPLVVPDARADERFQNNPLVTGNPNIRFYAGAPIVNTDGLALGTVCAIDRQPRQLTPEQITALQALSRQVLGQLELRRKAVDLEAACRKAEAADRLKSQFLASMSHELRTPLNGILGYAQILQRADDLNTHRHGVEIIQQSGAHLLALVNDLLDLAKIEADKLELYTNDFHLPACILSVVELSRVRAEQKELCFHFEPDPRLPVGVRADDKRLRQVLLNLLGNAIKFTTQGSVTLIAELSQPSSGARSDTARVRFSVRDTGVGMTTAQRARVFKPFEQVEAVARNVEGTGLGLTISQRLVELMGGQLEVASTLGAGSLFWFEIDLPLSPHWSAAAVQAPQGKITGYSGDRRKVLLVDDLAVNRNLLRELLEPLGFLIAEATDGERGLAELECFQPDLIISDLVMPNLDGISMVQQLRQGPHRDLPTIAASASASAINRSQAIAAGFSDFIAKPIEIEVLLSLLAKYLTLHWHYALSDGVAAASTDLPLIFPPLSQLKLLEQATRIGDIEGIRNEARRLQQLDDGYWAFGDRVLSLANDFNDTAISQLIGAARGDR